MSTPPSSDPPAAASSAALPSSTSAPSHLLPPSVVASRPLPPLAPLQAAPLPLSQPGRSLEHGHRFQSLSANPQSPSAPPSAHPLPFLPNNPPATHILSLQQQNANQAIHIEQLERYISFLSSNNAVLSSNLYDRVVLGLSIDAPVLANVDGTLVYVPSKVRSLRSASLSLPAPLSLPNPSLTLPSTFLEEAHHYPVRDPRHRPPPRLLNELVFYVISFLDNQDLALVARSLSKDFVDPILQVLYSPPFELDLRQAYLFLNFRVSHPPQLGRTFIQPSSLHISSEGYSCFILHDRDFPALKPPANQAFNLEELVVRSKSWKELVHFDRLIPALSSTSVRFSFPEITQPSESIPFQVHVPIWSSLAGWPSLEAVILQGRHSVPWITTISGNQQIALLRFLRNTRPGANFSITFHHPLRNPNLPFPPVTQMSELINEIGSLSHSPPLPSNRPAFPQGRVLSSH